ncbi:hypothetical protein PVAND_006552 [Polypedilum vanderplanki]|uniref:Reelin domain-containing protein n=1 Tax=Polypedilum vanderplanki TaxID=319348 RepID=A0A9J6C405_POLVA|nr:hypothetical protein PVAND_006552 [Polypedilum vanderplanki]
MECKIIFLLIALVPYVYSYSAGAPESECVDMTPRHHVEPQTTPFPYNILISKRQIRAGETVEVTIQGKTAKDTIKGLLVQARVGNTPIGTFDASASSQYIQLLNCGNSKGSAITHKKIENPPQSIKFYWTAPKGLKEKVTFFATVALNGGTFWTQQKSETLSVN